MTPLDKMSITRTGCGAALRGLGTGVLGVLLVFGLHARPAEAFFLNELHYDNVGTDVGEFFEIAGAAGTDLTGHSAVLYNGANGAVYNTINLTGVISNQQNGFGTLAFTLPTNGLQNGSPDGIALVDNTATVVQFLSYEGFFTAASGPANGLTSTDIGVSESFSTPAGESLQLTGTGNMPSDFSWTSPSAESPGAINTGQTFTSVAVAVPEPGTLTLFVAGLMGLAFVARR